MSTAANSYYFRRRTIGRAASPPTWACYEEIPYDDDYSSSCSDDDDDSCSENDEDYHPQQDQQQQHLSQVGRPEHSSDSEESENGKTRESTRKVVNRRENNGSSDIDIDMDQDAKGATTTTTTTTATGGDVKEKSEGQKDVKGKQRAVDPVPEPVTHGRRHRKKERQPTYTLRPILTIHRSQGFVWNQDLFIPPYAKDRYVASTSPPNARGFLSSNSSNTDYEVEVVEIRVKEGELDEYFH